MAEQAGNLEALLSEAAAVEAGEGMAAEEAQAKIEGGVVVDPNQEWIEAARHGAELFTALVPEVKPEWTGARVDALGEALGKCAEYYGWTVGGMFGHPLFGLALAGVPLAVPVVRVVKEKRAAAEEQQRKRQHAGFGAGVEAAPGAVASVSAASGGGDGQATAIQLNA